MSRSLRSCLCVCILWGGQALLTGGRAAAQELDPRVRKVLADWKKRQERVKTVRYRVEGEGIGYREALAIQAQAFKTTPPTKDERTSPKFTLLLDFTTNRHRLETEEYSWSVSTNKVTKERKIIAYDGKQITGVRPWTGESVTKRDPLTKKTDAAIGTGPRVLERAPFTDTPWPCFAGHGIVVISDREQITPGRLKFEPDLSLLTVHGQAVHNSRTCLVLRTPASHGSMPMFQEFWVDPGRDSALVRRRQFAGQTPTTDVEMEYQATSHGWLVRAWTITRRLLAPSGRVVTGGVVRFQVKELALDLPVTDSDFQAEIEPGMLVKKADGGEEGRLYRIGSDGDWHEVVREGGVERTVGGFSSWWLLALFPVAGLLLWWFRRWKQQARLASGA
jgi:hypothetical protein